MTTAENNIVIATDAQATDEAVLMLTRRIGRLYPEAYAAVITSLTQGLRDALNLADIRADSQRHQDKQAGVIRKFETIAERVDREMQIDGDEDQNDDEDSDGN